MQHALSFYCNTFVTRRLIICNISSDFQFGWNKFSTKKPPSFLVLLLGYASLYVLSASTNFVIKTMENGVGKDGLRARKYYFTYTVLPEMVAEQSMTQ